MNGFDIPQGVDSPVNVRNFRIGKNTEHMPEQIYFSNPGKELVAYTGALGRAPYQTRYITALNLRINRAPGALQAIQEIQARIGYLRNANVSFGFARDKA
jgi:hypothetical protein